MNSAYERADMRRTAAVDVPVRAAKKMAAEMLMSRHNVIRDDSTENRAVRKVLRQLAKDMLRESMAGA